MVWGLFLENNIVCCAWFQLISAKTGNTGSRVVQHDHTAMVLKMVLRGTITKSMFFWFLRYIFAHYLHVVTYPLVIKHGNSNSRNSGSSWGDGAWLYIGLPYTRKYIVNTAWAFHEYYFYSHNIIYQFYHWEFQVTRVQERYCMRQYFLWKLLYIAFT